MKPKDCIFIIQEIEKNGKKLWTMELATLKSIKFKINRDENTTPNQDKLLMAIYQRVTDVQRNYRR